MRSGLVTQDTFHTCALVTLQAQQLLAQLSAGQHHAGGDAFAGLGGLLSPEQAAAVAAVQQQQQQQQQQQAVQAAMLQVWRCSSFAQVTPCVCTGQQVSCMVQMHVHQTFFTCRVLHEFAEPTKVSLPRL